VGGSIASSFSGEPRSTIDIDIVAALEEQHVAALVSRLGSEFYAGRDVGWPSFAGRESTWIASTIITASSASGWACAGRL
jgi:hypothetical protein